MTSPGHKIGQILKLIYLRQYLSYSGDQMLKMSEMLMATFLVYSASGITSISMNYTFRDCRSKVNITGLLGDLGTNKQHCKLSQIQLFFRL